MARRSRCRASRPATVRSRSTPRAWRASSRWLPATWTPSPHRSMPTSATSRTPTGRARRRRPRSRQSPDSATRPRTSPATHGPRSRRTSTGRSTSCSPGTAETPAQGHDRAEVAVELLIRLSVEGAEHDLRIDAAPQGRVAALARDIAARYLRLAPGRPPPGLFRGATGERLDPAAPLGAAGLLSGDLLVAGMPPDPPAASPPTGSDGVCLDIVAGPEAGRSVVLSPRRYLVGRAAECDITIADPTVSRRQLTIDVRPGAPAVITSEPDVANPLLLDAVPRTGQFELGDDSVIQAGATAFVIRRFTRSVEEPRDRLGQVPFHRTPYRPSLITKRAFEPLGDIPKMPDRRRFAVLTALAPLGGGLAMY